MTDNHTQVKIYISSGDNHKTNKKDIQTLVDLDGMKIEQTGRHWVKFDVKQVTPTSEIPHGIRYSLTLHDQHGTRIMGFDNAHSVKGKNKNKFHGRKTYDHRHRHSKDERVPYEFTNAHQLIKDFWAEVDKTLNALGLEVDL